MPGATLLHADWNPRAAADYLDARQKAWFAWAPAKASGGPCISHALAKSIGVTKTRVVGHDIGLMVAYAYAAQFSAEVEKLVVMDAFLAGVAGWGLAHNNDNLWHLFTHSTPMPCDTRLRMVTSFKPSWTIRGDFKLP